jgi:Zn-dependent peptidase ImmA (M78 family)
VTRVDVNPKILRWAVERSSRIDHIRRSFPKLDQWLQGEVKPTLRQLERLAKATDVPLGYFFLDECPREELPIPFFRTGTTSKQTIRPPSRDLLAVVSTLERRQAWMREYLEQQGHERLSFVGSFSLDADPAEVSRSIREVLKLSDDWAAQERNWEAALRRLYAQVEDADIIVVSSSVVDNNPHRQLDPREFRGFVLVDEIAPFVFINSADAKAAQVFTLAHELAHIWLGKSAAFDLRDLQPASNPVERACDRIAAEFLVPRERLRQHWPETHGKPQPFRILAKIFKVSELVVARRALDLGTINEDTFLAFYREYLQRVQPVRAPKGGNFYATQRLRLGRRFAETVAAAVREGILLYHEAYRLTGLYASTFDRFFKHITASVP